MDRTLIWMEVDTKSLKRMLHVKGDLKGKAKRKVLKKGSKRGLALPRDVNQKRLTCVGQEMVRAAQFKCPLNPGSP